MQFHLKLRDLQGFWRKTSLLRFLETFKRVKEDGEREDDLFYVTQAKVSSENMSISHSPWNWQMLFSLISRFVEVAGTWWDAPWEREIAKMQCVFSFYESVMAFCRPW